MRTIIFLPVAIVLIASYAQAQTTKRTATAQPAEMNTSINTQNTQNSQNSQSPAPKPANQNAEPKKGDNGNAEATPAVDNKIAVSDPGTPGAKPAQKKAPASPSEPKKSSSPVSPK